MTWYKVYKTFRGGKSEIDYIQVPKYARKNVVEEFAIDWAESISGGRNYGWRVHWSYVKKPPKKWLKKEIQRMKDNIKHYYNFIALTKTAIKDISELLNE